MGQTVQLTAPDYVEKTGNRRPDPGARRHCQFKSSAAAAVVTPLTPERYKLQVTADNIQLRCRAHNQFEAQLLFGDTLVRERQEVWCTPAAHRRSCGS